MAHFHYAFKVNDLTAFRFIRTWHYEDSANQALALDKACGDALDHWFVAECTDDNCPNRETVATAPFATDDAYYCAVCAEPFDSAESADGTTCVHCAVKAMSHDQREAFMLALISNTQPHEVAEMLLDTLMNAPKCNCRQYENTGACAHEGE